MSRVGMDKTDGSVGSAHTEVKGKNAARMGKSIVLADGIFKRDQQKRVAEAVEW